MTAFFACCVPEYSDFAEYAANIFDVLPDVSHGDNDRGPQNGVVNSVLSTEEGTSIVKVPGQASTIYTMSVVPRLVDHAETGQLVMATIDLSKIFSVDHCALPYIGPNVTPVRTDASKVPFSYFSSPGVLSTITMTSPIRPCSITTSWSNHYFNWLLLLMCPQLMSTKSVLRE